MKFHRLVKPGTYEIALHGPPKKTDASKGEANHRIYKKEYLYSNKRDVMGNLAQSVSSPSNPFLPIPLVFILSLMSFMNPETWWSTSVLTNSNKTRGQTRKARKVTAVKPSKTPL